MSEQMQTQYCHPAFGPDTIRMGREPDDTYKVLHYDLCQALNMTRMSVVLQKMVDAGFMDRRMAELFHTQAGALLAVMVSENNRGFSARLTPLNEEGIISHDDR